MSKPAPKEITAQLERQAWELRMRAWSHDDIADELKVSQAAVARMLKRVADRLHAAFLANIEQMRTEQTSQLTEIAKRAIAAFESIQNETLAQSQPESTESTESTPSTEPTTSTATPSLVSPESLKSLQSAPMLGASINHQPHKGSSYLRTALNAYAAIRALWGMEQPKKAVSKNQGPHIKGLVGVSIDDLKHKFDKRIGIGTQPTAAVQT